MTKWDYPELIKNGTIAGPVTPKMREMCKAHVRSANRFNGSPEDDGMEYWPDFLPMVREELKGKDDND